MKQQNYYEMFKDFSADELTDYLESCCQNNDIEAVKYLVSNSELTLKPSLNGERTIYTNHDNAILISCELGNLEILDILLTSHDIDNNVKDIKTQLDEGLLLASQTGKVDIIKYLLTSDKISRHPYINHNNGEALCLACENGHLEAVRYLLASPDLKEHIPITARRGFYLLEACWNEHFEVVRYLLTSPELKEHPSIHNNDDEIFSYALSENKIDLINFLIFEIGIEKNENIIDLLEEQQNEKVKGWFQLRELNKDLKADLSEQISISKKVKI